MMRFILVILLHFTLIINVSGQVYMKSGIIVGPNFTWPDKNSGLTDGFFGVTRTGFQTGICNSLQAGSHFFSKISLLYSMQNFAVRQTGLPAWRTDVRYSISRFEIPLVAGTSGFLGNLRHREYLGAALSFHLSEKSTVTASGDSLSAYVFGNRSLQTKQSALLLLAGFEVGTTFKNDVSLYFGGVIRWGLDNIYTGAFDSNRFPSQQAKFKGSYVGLEITLYLPRYSYWFKREFTY